MSATSAQREAAELALTDLEKLRRAAWLDTLATRETFGAGVKDDVLRYLEFTVPEAIASLRRQLDRVDTRGYSWQRWVENAESLRSDIAAIAGDVTKWSLKGVLLATGEKTARDVGQGLQEVGAAAKSGTTWGVLAALIVLYVAWKVS